MLTIRTGKPSEDPHQDMEAKHQPSEDPDQDRDAKQASEDPQLQNDSYVWCCLGYGRKPSCLGRLARVVFWGSINLVRSGR